MFVLIGTRASAMASASPPRAITARGARAPPPALVVVSSSSASAAATLL
jgi:hypothetical protein